MLTARDGGWLLPVFCNAGVCRLTPAARHVAEIHHLCITPAHKLSHQPVFILEGSDIPDVAPPIAQQITESFPVMCSTLYQEVVYNSTLAFVSFIIFFFFLLCFSSRLQDKICGWIACRSRLDISGMLKPPRCLSH